MQFTVVKLLHLEQITYTNYFRAVAMSEENNTQMTSNTGNSNNAHKGSSQSRTISENGTLK